MIAAGIAIVVFSFVFLHLAESMDLAYICWMASGVTLLISIYCSIFIINLHPPSTLTSTTLSTAEAQTPPMNCCQSLSADFLYGFTISRKRKMILVVIILTVGQTALDSAFS